MIDFTWYRDEKGYDLLSETPLAGANYWQGRVAEGLSAPREFPTLFRLFANIQKTPGGALELYREVWPTDFRRTRWKGRKYRNVIEWAEMMEKRLRQLRGDKTISLSTILEPPCHRSRRVSSRV